MSKASISMTSSSMDPLSLAEALVLKKLKAEMKTLGLAQCPACQLAFLTFSGIKKHMSDGCKGVLKNGDYVSCNYCLIKFTRYTSAMAHKQKAHPDEMLAETASKHSIKREQSFTQYANINASGFQGTNLNEINEDNPPNMIPKQSGQMISNSLRIVRVNSSCGETRSGEVMSSPGSSINSPATFYTPPVQSYQPNSMSFVDSGANPNLHPVSSPQPVQSNKVYLSENSQQTEARGWTINGQFFSIPNQNPKDLAPAQPEQNNEVDPYGSSQEIKARGWTVNKQYISQKASTKPPIIFRKDVKTESNFVENSPTRPAPSVQGTSQGNSSAGNQYVKMLREDGSVVLMKLNISNSGVVKPKLLFPKPVQSQAVSSNYCTQASSSMHRTPERPVFKPEQQTQVRLPPPAPSFQSSPSNRYIQIIRPPVSQPASNKTSSSTVVIANRIQQQMSPKMVRVLNPVKPPGAFANVAYKPQPIVTNAQTIHPGIARLPPSLDPGTELPASVPLGLTTHQEVLDAQVYQQNELPGPSITTWEDNANQYRSLQPSENQVLGAQGSSQQFYMLTQDHSPPQQNINTGLEREESVGPLPGEGSYLDQVVTAGGPSEDYSSSLEGERGGTELSMEYPGSGSLASASVSAGSHDQADQILTNSNASEDQFSSSFDLKTGEDQFSSSFDMKTEASQDTKLWNNVVRKQENISPMNMREKRLKEEEDRIAQLEALAKQYIMSAEKVKREQDLERERERELAITKKEEELRRREETAQRLMEDARKVLEGYSGREEMSTPGMEVTDMTTFSEDTSVAGKLSLEPNPVSLTRDELEALSPSERPKNPLIVDRIVEDRSASGEGLHPVNHYKSLVTEGHLAASLQLDQHPPHHLDQIQHTPHHLDKHPSDHLDQHPTDHLDQHPPHHLHKHPPHHLNQQTPHHLEQHPSHDLRQDVLDKKTNISLPAVNHQQTKKTDDNSKPSLTACYKQISSLDQAQLNFPECSDDTRQLNQDEPLDLSKHDAESDRILKQSIQEISKRFQSQNNQTLHSQESRDFNNKEKDLTDLLEISNLSNELMTETEANAKEMFTATADVDPNDPLIIPFPEFEAENLEKLLNESPDGIIMSVDDEGKMFQIPTFNSDHDPLACEESGNTNDVRLSSPSVQQDDLALESGTQDDIAANNAIPDDKVACSDNQDNKVANSDVQKGVKDTNNITKDSHKPEDGSVTVNTEEPATNYKTKAIETTSALDDVNNISDDNHDDESSMVDDHIESNEEDICDTNSSPVRKKSKSILKSIVKKKSVNKSAVSLPFRLNSLPPSRRSSRLSTQSCPSPNKYKSMLNYNKLPRKRKEPCASTDTIEESKVDDVVEDMEEDIEDDNVPVRKSLRTKKKKRNYVNDTSISVDEEISDDEDYAVEEKSPKTRRRIRNALDSSKVKAEQGKETYDKIKKRKLQITLNSISMKEKPSITESEMFSSLPLTGGRKRRAAAKKAERKFQAISRNQKGNSDGSDFSDIFSDDSEDNFDLSSEITRKKMYKIEHIMGGESKVYRCKLCTETFPTKNKIDSHFIVQHSRELFTQEQESDEDEFCERGISNRSSFNKSSRRGSTVNRLDPDPVFLERETEFRALNYYKAGEMAEWYSRLTAGQAEEEKLMEDIFEDASHYLPSHGFNPSFRLSSSQQDSQTLDQLSSCVSPDKSNCVLSTGGPVWALAWTPQPTPSPVQYLALATHTSPESTQYNEDNIESKKGLIQLWKLDMQNNAEKITDKPVYIKGIIHDFGKIWCLDWCPSGCFTPGTTLGLLAASCSDGTVRLLDIKFPSDNTVELVKANCIKTLVLNDSSVSLDEDAGHCLDLSWYRGTGHRYLAASYKCGSVALWDNATTSSLLHCGVDKDRLLPTVSWNAHNSSVTSVSLSVGEESEHPTYCVTGGTDRCYRFWDLRDTSTPLQEIKRGMVTCVSLIPGLAAAAISHDDVYLQAHTQSLLTDSGFSRNSGMVGSTAQPIVAQNSCIWDHDLSSYLGSLALVTSAGELLVYVLPDANKPVDQNRSSMKRRAYVYTIQNNDDKPLETTKDKDAVDLYYNNFWDTNPLSDKEKELQKQIKYSETMKMENLTKYPVLSLNRVAWNPNLGSHVLLASGGQCGLARIDILNSLQPNHEEE